jgi:hypothetical protein
MFLFQHNFMSPGRMFAPFNGNCSAQQNNNSVAAQVYSNMSGGELHAMFTHILVDLKNSKSGHTLFFLHVSA